MTTTFKTLTENDKSVQRSELHEAIPITGSIILSGGYADANIKNFSHGLFQQVYDYPFLSSSANPIFSLTMGYSDNSSLSASTNHQNAEKINMYNQMAKVLVGLDATGSIRDFDQDGDFSGGTKMREVFFINFNRLLTKDGIKRGSFDLELGVGNAFDEPMSSRVFIRDTAATTTWKTNSPAGEYGILTASNSTGSAVTASIVGLVYYQAGIAVITASIFDGAEGGHPYGHLSQSAGLVRGAFHPYEETGSAAFTGSTMSGACDGFRSRWQNLNMVNTIELNSSLYFLRLNNNEFNYSSNPTYLSESKIRVKNTSQDSPVSYVTTVGLYSDDNELLLVGKLSEPLKKTADNEITIRARADY